MVKQSNLNLCSFLLGVLCVVLCFSKGVSGIQIDSKINDIQTEAKTIIFVPGIFGSVYSFKEPYFDDKTGIFHEKNEIVEIGRTTDMRESDFFAKGLLQVATETSEYLSEEDRIRARSGHSGYLGRIIDYFEKDKAINNVDFHVFQYDWLAGIDDPSKKLQEEIKKYGSVSLIGYSLGGLVVSKALELLDEENKLSMVKKAVLLGSPLAGCPQASCVLLGFSDYIPPKWSNLSNFAKVTQVAYDLLPNDNYGCHPSVIQGVSDKSPNDGYGCYTLSVTSGLDEKTYKLSAKRLRELIPVFFNNVNPKKLIKAKDIHDSLYKNNKHVLTKVDFNLLLGSGHMTVGNINFKFKTNPETDLNPVGYTANLDINSADVSIDKIDGDGLVPLKETMAVFGEDLNEFCNNGKILISNTKHGNFITDQTILQKIRELLCNC